MPGSLRVPDRRGSRRCVYGPTRDDVCRSGVGTSPAGHHPFQEWDHGRGYRQIGGFLLQVRGHQEIGTSGGRALYQPGLPRRQARENARLQPGVVGSEQVVGPDSDFAQVHRARPSCNGGLPSPFGELVSPWNPCCGEGSVEAREECGIPRRHDHRGAPCSGRFPHPGSGHADEHLRIPRRSQANPSGVREDQERLREEKRGCPSGGHGRWPPHLEGEVASVVAPQIVGIGLHVTAHATDGEGPEGEDRRSPGTGGGGATDAVPDHQAEGHPAVVGHAGRPDGESSALVGQGRQTPSDQQAVEVTVPWDRGTCVEDDDGNVLERRSRGCACERRCLHVGDQMDLARRQIRAGDQRDRPFKSREEISGRVGDSGRENGFSQLRPCARDGHVPWLAGPDEPDAVFVASAVDALDGHRLQEVENPTASPDQARAHGVVENDDRSGGIMHPTSTSKEGSGTGPNQQEDGSHPEQEEQQLAQPDGAGMLLLCPKEVAKGRKRHAASVVTVEEVQYQGYGHRQSGQEEDR